MLDFNTSVIIKIVSSLFFLVSGMIWKNLLLSQSKNYHFIFFRVLSTIFFLSIIIGLLKVFDCTIFSQISNNLITIKDWIFCISLCLFSFWGLYFYTNAIQSGRYSFVTPLITISASFSFVTSLLIYNERLSVSKYIAIAVIIIGLVVHQKNKLKYFKLSKEVVLILLCSVFWGVSSVFYLIPIKKFGVLNFSLILEFCVFISCIGLLIFNEKTVYPPKIATKSKWLCLLMGLMVAFGSLLGNFTLMQIPVSLNILIGLIFEMIVLIIGLFIFHENLSRNDWLLIGIATIGSLLFLF